MCMGPCSSCAPASCAGCSLPGGTGCGRGEGGAGRLTARGLVFFLRAEAFVDLFDEAFFFGALRVAAFLAAPLRATAFFAGDFFLRDAAFFFMTCGPITGEGLQSLA